MVKKKERKELTSEMRHAIIERDNYSCRDCGKKLWVWKTEDFAEQLTQLKEIPVYLLVSSCWNCNKPVRLHTYYFLIGYNYCIGDIEKLDRALMEKYPDSIKEVYSNTMESDVINNVCKNCGAQQGNWYVRKDFIEAHVDGGEFHTVGTLPNTLEIRDIIPPEEPTEFEYLFEEGLAHIHHVDSNPMNNAEENLVLLCAICHRKRHRKTD